MRELTDRELDAVCGGLSISFSQSIWNKQVNTAKVWQSAAVAGNGNATNTANVNQSNSANNQNQLQIGPF